MVMCECFREVVESRYSVRLFQDKPIPKSIVEEILRAGIRAPTAGGGEQWFFIVVEDEAKRRQLHKLLKEAHLKYAMEVRRTPMPPEKVEKWGRKIDEGMYMAPLYIAAYIDLRTRQYKDEYLELEKLWAAQSLAAAIENIILTAWNHGIGSVWLGVPLLMREEFDKLLEPPQGCELQAIIAMGYTVEQLKPKTRRRDLSEIVKWI